MPRTEARLGEVSQELQAARERVARLERQTPDLLATIDRARRAVAFLVVGYALYEASSGKPLRFVSVDASGAPQPDDKGAYETSVDGGGPIVVSYATGSGFVIADNRLVTNRHVAEPWWGEPSIEAARQRGFEPRRTLARAYFRELAKSVALDIVAVSTEADVALLRMRRTPRSLSDLKLAPADVRVRSGDLVVVLGYPTGFGALLARTEEAVAAQLVETTGEDPPSLADQLAIRRLISPLVTLGHVGDVMPQTIVYDAATAEGGSGGPVLNATGEVLAVNYAQLADFAGARFGIPIRFVHRLVNRPGASRPR